MGHFLYRNLPAKGMGKRDPFRPKVTGGLGSALYLVIITDIEAGLAEFRWYMGDPKSDWATLYARSGWVAADPDKGAAVSHNERMAPVADLAQAPGPPNELWYNSSGGTTLWPDLGYNDKSVTTHFTVGGGIGIPSFGQAGFIVDMGDPSQPAADYTNIIMKVMMRGGDHDILFGTGVEVTAALYTAIFTAPVLVHSEVLAGDDTQFFEYQFALTPAEVALLDETDAQLYLLADILFAESDPFPVDIKYAVLEYQTAGGLSYGEPELVWEDGDGEKVWAIWVGDELWTISSATMKWDTGDSGVNWMIKGAQSSWSIAESTIKWSMGDAF